MTTEVLHIVGPLIEVGPLRRQRCSWCGHLLLDDNLRNMAWPLDPDGTDPGPPPGWPERELLAVAGDSDSFRVLRVVWREELPDSETPGHKRVPDNCCAALDPEATK